MKYFRPHRFPNLSRAQATQSAQFDGAAVQDAGTGWQEGYEQGQVRGFDEGYASGLEQGRQDGLAEGRRKGLELGREDGRAEAVAEFANLAVPLDKALTSLRKLHDDYQSAMRRELVDLVAKVSRQVIRCELALQPKQLVTLVEETLSGMPPANGKVEVLFNPLDLERVLDLDPQRAQMWNLVADPRLEAGECRVKSGGQEADAGCRQRLQACIDQIEAQVLGDEPADETASAAVVQNEGAEQ